MNEYGVAILAFVVGEYVLEVCDALLNLGALTTQMPAGFEDVYDKKEYARSQVYTKAKTRLGIVANTYALALGLALWFGKGYVAFDAYARSFGFGSIGTGLLFFGIAFLFSTVTNLPIEIYSDFVLEARFGFNKKTPHVFLTDLAKSLALTAALGGPLAATVLLLFEKMGDMAWAYCWVAVTMFMLIITFIAPKYILPLFFELNEVEDGPLKTAIYNLTDKLDFQFGGLYVIDGSKRSSHSNAFFAGFGSTKRICLFDTLIDQQNVDEIVAVLGHEIGHYKRHHVYWGLFLQTLVNGLMLGAMQLVLTSPDLSAAFYMPQPSLHTGMLFFATLFTPANLVLSLALHARSRSQEYEADRYSVDVLGTSTPLASSLKKLAAQNLANLTPHPLHVFLTHSHPPLPARVAAIEAYAAKRYTRVFTLSPRLASKLILQRDGS